MPNAQRHVSHGLLGEEARRRMASAGGDFNWSERGDKRDRLLALRLFVFQNAGYAQGGRPVPAERRTG
jgi:hypothetical protein